MLPVELGPYAEETFDMYQTVSVRVIMNERDGVRVDLLKTRLPARHLYGQKLPDVIEIAQVGEYLPYARINVFLSPEGLPQKKLGMI